jgi:cyclomaltodextrinase / maltogenic alpha-amylase / neopullulanase
MRKLIVGVFAISLCVSAVAQQPETTSAQASTVAQLAARTPVEWVKSGVIYEIYPRQFSGSGDFKGVEARLPELQKLGVTILWLMPIHPMGQLKKKGTVGSPYAVQDYYAVNPAYGTKDDFKHLVRAAHDRGMKVVMDIVANHTSWDSVLIKQHPDWFKHDAKGNIIWPYDWTDIAWLDYSHPPLRAYMTDMLKYWLRDFELDGFRCDVAGEVPTDFWESARVELEKIKPGIFMLAESEKPELLVRAFDADYGWAMYHALAEVIENGAPSTLIRQTWQEQRAKYPRAAMHMGIFDDHDETRGIVRFGERGELAAAAFVLTSEGLPLLYNGDEVGDSAESGAPALFEKMPIFWQISERLPMFPKFFQQMIALRKAHAALQQGQTEWVENSDPKRVVTYLRSDGSERVLVAVNLSSQPFSGAVTAPSGSFQEITPVLDEKAPAPKPLAAGALELPAWGFRVWADRSPAH